jgi:membrane protein required for colicin V production
VIGGLSWVDWALLAVLALSVVAGLVRGFVFEVMALIGWVVAWFVAQWFAPEVAPHLPVGKPGGALNLVLAFVLTFVAGLVVWGLLARLLRMLIHATPLSLPDRALGAGFGLLRGGVLLLAVATVVALSPAATSHAWRASQGALWLNSTLHGLKPVLPEAVARRLPAD